MVGLPAVFAIALVLTPAEPTMRTTSTSAGDAALWTAIVSDMARGQTYYEASATELRARHYPTRSIFNWRQPLVYELLATFGPGRARLLLLAIAIWLVLQAGHFLRWRIVALVAMINATLMMIAPWGAYFTELWAGSFLALSVLAYAQRRERSGAAWALMALFVRELAAPYCLLATSIALWRRRWGEVTVWGIGAASYGIYYGWHVWHASRYIQPDDVSHAQSWLYWGGISFLLETWRHNGLLLISPTPLFALAVVGVAAAAWARQMPLHLRAGVVAYTASFLAVGQPFNGYWGFLTAPLMALWFAYAPAGLRVLSAAPNREAGVPLESDSMIERAIHWVRAARDTRDLSILGERQLTIGRSWQRTGPLQGEAVVFPSSPDGSIRASASADIHDRPT